ncbi:ATP-dependent acyl-CoA ligase [soil metagenome]
MAHGLRLRGIRPGERVLLHLDNCPEFLIAWCACALAGAIAVTTNTRSADDELCYFIDQSEPVAAVTQPRHYEQLGRCGPRLHWVAVTADDAGTPPDAATAPSPDEAFARLLQASPASGPLADIGSATPMAIQYTSGTTSRPKAVLWTHANALWGARICATHEGLTAADVHCCMLPLFHTNALSYSMLATLWAGGTLVLQPRFSASRFWDIARRNDCTWSCITAFCWRALLNVERPIEHRFRFWGVAAAEPRIHDAFGVGTVSWWGMSETITQGIVSVPHLPPRAGTIGLPAPEYGIRVVDDEGRQVERGDTGWLQVLGRRGLSLFAGYYGDDAATAASYCDDGWFNTGDAITVEDDGLLRFADRRKDMMKVGGENVASTEVERVIAAIDGVEEAIVLARPHAMLDEVPVAFVVLRVDHSVRGADYWRDVVLAQCRQKLADFKVPREVHLVTDVPRTSVGKVAKAAL